RDQAYTIVSEAIDRSGMGRATLAPRMGMSAPVPPLRPRPTLSMKDMGMGDMQGMDHGAASGSGSHAGMDHGSMAGTTGGAAAPASGAMAGMDHGADASAMAGMDHSSMDMRDGSTVSFPVGVGVDMIAPSPVDRTGDPGIGLEDVGHRVLTYKDLVSLTPN